MKSGHAFIGIGFAFLILLVAAVYWFRFRPNYGRYGKTFTFKPLVSFWKINNGKKWQVFWLIATVVTILAAILVVIIGFLGGFGN